MGDEVWVYWGADSQKFLSRDVTGKERMSSFFLAKFRRDRSAGWTPESADGGELLTTPFRLDPSRLRLNANASGGEIRAELCDPGGAPLSGFSRNECEPLRSDGLELRLVWKNKAAGTNLDGKSGALRIILHGTATAYALVV